MRMNSRIVRREAFLKDSLSTEQADAFIAETDFAAISDARQMGIQQMHVSRLYDLWVCCTLLDYPMWMLGPGAPKIESYQDAWALGYHCRYIITIRCQDEVDRQYAEWETRQKALAQ